MKRLPYIISFKGLKLRPSKDSGDIPIKFELVYRDTPEGGRCIDDLSTDEVAACSLLKNGFSLRELTM